MPLSKSQPMQPSARGSSLAGAEPSGSSVKADTSQTTVTYPKRPSLASFQHKSSQSLRLDLEGLDLGGSVGVASTDQPGEFAEPQQMNRHLRSQSSNASRPRSLHGPKAISTGLLQSASVPTEVQSTSPLVMNEDSFSAHLRAECTDYREIMTSQVAISAVRMEDEKSDDPDVANLDHLDRRPSYGQVLGGFASLGLQTAAEPQAVPPRLMRQHPTRTPTTHSTDSSDAPNTPRDGRDSFDCINPKDYSTPTRWANLTGRPCNPLEPLDILSIEEMGLQGLDIGSLNDWEGTKLSAEILCPINGHMRIEWSIAHATRRTKKWVVVPNSTIVCGSSERLTPEARAQRTVVVGERSLWSDVKQADSDAKVKAAFSGRAGFEVRTLRPEPGKISPPVYLANASTHRLLHSFRTGVDMPLITACGSTIDPAELSGTQHVATQPVYPVLRRSRSRPYLRPEHVPLRRSRSKPYLRYSAKQQTSTLMGPDGEYAPSLPGDKLSRFQPGEHWPSARATNTGSLSSLETSSSSDPDSDASSQGLCLNAVTSRSSTAGSTSAGSSGAKAALKIKQSLRPIRPAVEDNPGNYSSKAALSASPPTSTTSSKPSKSKGLSRLTKDKVLSGWFKKKTSVITSLPPFAGTPSITQLVYSPPVLAEHHSPAAQEPSMPLTQYALDHLQKTQPGSPDPTVVGSRRGSEALTQKAVDSKNAQNETVRGRAFTLAGLSPNWDDDDDEEASVQDSRAAVNSTLAEIYGWDAEMVAEKTVPQHPTPKEMRRAGMPARDSLFQNMDEENALLGLDAVPADALTMLIPLPFLGRVRSEEAMRYIRVNFVPFREVDETPSLNRVTPSSEAEDFSTPTTPMSQKDLAALAHSINNGSSSNIIDNSGKASEWKRKLGLASSSSRQQQQPRAGGRARGNSAGASTPSPLGNNEAFRVTAIILGAPWAPPSVCVDPRISEEGTFPVVLGYCNGNKSLDMVPEGWAALKLGGHTEPIKADGTPLDGPHPQHAVTDAIIAACAAVMGI